MAKLTAGGEALLYSTYLGGSGKDVAYAVAVDGAGQACLIGDTESDDLPTRKPLQPTRHGRSEAFVAKLSSDQPSGIARQPAVFLARLVERLRALLRLAGRPPAPPADYSLHDSQ